MKKNFKKNISITLVLIFIIALMLPCFADTATQNVSNTSARTIKVGYIDYKGFIEKDADGVYFGYGVDYLKEISKYTGWKIEYVYDTWENHLENLKQGKIDLLCHAQQTEERKQEYDFSKHSDGAEASIVYAKEYDDRFYYGDNESFNGAKVGFLKDSFQNASFDEYAKLHNFTYSKTEYATDAQVFEALENGDVDIVAMGSLSTHDNLKIVARFGVEPYFFMVQKGNNDLLIPLNGAVDEIKLNTPRLEADLYTKYYGQNSVNTQLHLTKSEAEFIAKCPTLLISVSGNMNPMTYKAPNSNKLTGINYDVLELISKKSGIDFEYYEIEVSDKNYEMDFFRKKHISLISSIEVNEFNENLKDLTITSKYFSSQKAMVARQGENISATAKAKVALVGGSQTLPKVIKKRFPNFQIVYYKTLQECMEAVRLGKADVLIYNQYILQKNLDRPQYRELCVVPELNLSEDIAISTVQYEENSSEAKYLNDLRLISILNKTINSISQPE
ncbi:MAG: transporter substrate-binding domain-containing protein, partial [Oscillospiraceae bacterium]